MKIPEPLTTIARKTGYAVDDIKRLSGGKADDSEVLRFSIRLNQVYAKIYGKKALPFKTEPPSEVSTEKDRSRVLVEKHNIWNLMDGLLDGRRYSIGDISRLTGRSPRTCRRWADRSMNPDTVLELTREENAALFLRLFKDPVDSQFVRYCRERGSETRAIGT